MGKAHDETTEGGEQTMAETEQDARRYQLLGVLFGPDVPQALKGHLLRTSDVATLFQVSERTVSEWAKRGQIPSVRTPGGHRRYPADAIRALLQEDPHMIGSPKEADFEDASVLGPPASVTDLSDRRPATA
jgi:excisionase family DNA binding protein